jgi:TRAP-type uncharacterized transport system fused permease subunit
VETLSGGHLVIALIITMFVSILLGCGVPTTAAYSLVAIVVVPILVKMGVLDICAHFFAFYFAIISALTPPVALAALAGAGIAQANYWQTAINSFKLAISGFILPFLIIYNPALILRPVSVEWTVGTFLAVPIGLATLTAWIYGCGLTVLTSLERWISLFVAVMMFGYCLFRHIEEIPFEYPMLVVGTAGFVMLLRMQLRHKREFALQRVQPVTV